jgi:retron-type reverse transcriptase
VRFTALLHHISVDLLKQSYHLLARDSAPGTDGVTWQAYADNLEAKLTELHDRIHKGSYRARPARRTYIPKADGSQRPLSIWCLEDKIVQQAVVTVLEAIYEEDFVGFSYGFRPGRGQHDALDALHVGILRRQVNWVLDADIRGFLDPVSYCPLVDEAHANSSAGRVNTLILSPFCRPRVTWTASISPRLTRCNTVCRETPSALIASRMGR